MAQKNVTRDMTQGSPLKLILTFSLPLLGGFLFQQLYSFMDTMVVGGVLGTEALAAVGAAALLVPFPSAVDDHQTTNARFLADADAAWLVPQAELTPEYLAKMLQKTERSALLERALKAKTLQKLDASAQIVAACEEICS